MEELRDIVMRSLENKKVLGGIRARLRTEILAVIQDEQKASKNYQIYNKGAHDNILESEDSKTALSYVFNFLSFFKLEYTTKVLLQELNINNTEVLPKLDSQECQITKLLSGEVSDKVKSVTNTAPEPKKNNLLNNLPSLNKPEKNIGKLAPISNQKHDFAFDDDMINTNMPQSKSPNQPKQNVDQKSSEKRKSNEYDLDDFEEVDEEIEGDTLADYNKLDTSENKDKFSISQSGAFTDSYGFDGSVDSTILEGFDYVENVVKPRRF